MKRAWRNVVCLVVVTILVLGFFPMKAEATQSKKDNFSKSYTLTGDQAKDIVAVGMAQKNKTQSQLGYTEGWCADFVGDCARLAGIATSVIPTYGGVGGLMTKVKDGGGYEVTSPKCGDLVFYNSGSSWCHVGIMTDSTNSIQGNISSKVTYMKYNSYRTSSGNAASKIVFVRPNYSTAATCVLRTNNNYSGKNYLYGTNFTSLNSEYWQSRDTSVSTISIDSSNTHNGYNSLKIVNSSAGESGKDLAIQTLTSPRPTDGFVGDDKYMTLSFYAKSSVSGTKMYFRWGFESTGYRDVTFTTSWQKYTIRMDKNTTLNHYIHPYIDRAGTVWISEMQLEDGTSATAFVPENNLPKDTKCSKGSTFNLPANPTRTGYTFAGWYTSAKAGTQVTSSTKVTASLTVYAHWTANTYTLRVNKNYSGKNYLPGTAFESLDSEHWYSRDTSVTTLSVDSSNKHNGYNSLKIVNTSAGALGKDLALATLTRSSTEKGYTGDNKNMGLSFYAKASVSGTGIYFRWGWEDTSTYRGVSLTTSWAKYTIPMNKQTSFGDYMHPYVDRAGTVWISEVQLEDGTTATAFSPEPACYTEINETYDSYYKLPDTPVRSGYAFTGWYTAPSGGTKITTSTKVKGNETVFAHWGKLPVITTQPVNSSVIIGNTAKFTVAASGTGLSYQWYYRNSSADTWKQSSADCGKTSTFTFTAQESHSGHQYKCVISNSYGSVTTNTVTVTVRPKITTQPKNVSVVIGNTAKFTVAATGTDLKYQWYYRNSSTDSWKASTMACAKTAAYSFTAQESHSGHQYYCKVTSKYGSTNSNTVTVTVNPKITTQPKSITTSAGKSVKFTVAAQGTNLKYQWYYRNSSSDTWKASTSASGKTAVFSFTAQKSHSGHQYYCKVTSKYGTTNSGTVTITVK